MKGTEIGCLGAGGMEGERPGSTMGRTATWLLGQEGGGERDSQLQLEPPEVARKAGRAGLAQEEAICSMF